MTSKILPRKPCANKCCVRKCGKPAHADLWIEENGSWVSFCTPHARFALKPTYTELASRPSSPDKSRIEALESEIAGLRKEIADWSQHEAGN